MSNNQEDLTREEQIRLDHLRSLNANPATDLESRTVNRLRNEGLITTLQRQYKWYWHAAAAIFLLALGMYAGTQVAGDDHEESFSYVLLLHQDDTFPEDRDGSRYTEYGAWMRTIRQAGMSIIGEKVDRKVIVAGKDSIYTDKRSARVSGFFMISAASQEEALKVAAESPHVKYGGTIEVRKIVNQ
jgi:hypothetical protein